MSSSSVGQQQTTNTGSAVASPGPAKEATSLEAADPFAGLLELGSPVGSGSAAQRPLAAPQQAPLSSSLESTLSPLSPPPGADAVTSLAEPLSLALNAAAAPATMIEGIATVRVLQEEGLTVDLKCRAGPPGSCEILAEFAADQNSKPLTQFRFEAAVPKYLQLHLEPPSDDVVMPGSSPVQQRMRVTSASTAAGQPSYSKALLMKCRITFLREGSLVQKCASVSSFPHSLLGA